MKLGQTRLTLSARHKCLASKICLYCGQAGHSERNYNVGNNELLVLVLALQEWQHWLAGSTQPFVVWTDHNNLAYLQSTRRLNSRQARWVLFLGWFNFLDTYRPSSKNTKPDALSRQFSADLPEPEPGPILPPSCVAGAATQ